MAKSLTDHTATVEGLLADLATVFNVPDQHLQKARAAVREMGRHQGPGPLKKFTPGLPDAEHLAALVARTKKFAEEQNRKNRRPVA